MKKMILIHIKRAVLLLLLLVPVSCTNLYRPDPGFQGSRYREQIIEWQQRIDEQGWSHEIVDDIVDRSIEFSKFEAEPRDHWATPGEFIGNGFVGDCEDIAVFAMGTLKQLDYPRKVRILLVHTLMGDHALLKVETAADQWKTYETVPMPFVQIDQLFYRPILEFDEKSIVYFQRKGL